MKFTLRGYQEEALSIMKDAKFGERKLIAIPTGGGKTLIFAELAHQSEGRVLIIVPSKELREQAYNKIKDINDTLDVGNVQASLDEVNAKIVIASRQSLTHNKSTRIERMLEFGEFEYIVFDEAHQAVNQIKKIVANLNTNAKVIGVTATPYNHDMKKVFSKIDYQKTIMEMIEQDYLCEPKAIIVDSATNLNHVKIVAGEFNQKELEEAVNNIERNVLVVEAYKKYACDRISTLVFATGIAHSKSLAKEFCKRDIHAKSIDGTMKPTEREGILDEFTSGKLPVLVNVAVLTTGFDHPPTDCIILSSPTKSKIKYIQVIGRGLRQSFETNKTDCLIIDINDVVRNHDLMSMSSVFDVNIKSGETPRKAYERSEIEKEEARLKQEELLRKQEELEKQRQDEIEVHAKKIRLFNKEMNMKFAEAIYDWYRVDNMLYALSYKSDMHIVIEQEDDDRYNLYFVSTEKENKFVNEKGEYGSLNEVIEFVESKMGDKENSFVMKNGHWKLHKPTDNQLKYVSWARSKWDCHKYFAGNGIKSVMKKYR